MTIHKSKGLEFDHVFLPGLNSASGTDSKPLLHWQKRLDQHNRWTLLMAPLGAHDQDDDSVYSYLRHQESVRSKLEDTRVLYVAATRAIKHLYLSAKLTELKDGKYRTPGKSTLLHSIWPSIETAIEQGIWHVTKTETSRAGSESQQNFKPLMLRRLPQNFSQEVDTRFEPVEINASVAQRTMDFDALSPRLRHLGTVLHRTLKQIVRDGVEQWSSEKVRAREIVWKTQLKEMGVLATTEELKNLEKAITNMLGDETGRWILADHDQSACELSLSYTLEEHAMRGTSVLDRTFICDNVRWVIDYKYSWPNDGQPLTTFLRDQSITYAAQMAHYAKLAAKLGKQPVHCALYFPMIAEFALLSVE